MIKHNKLTLKGKHLLRTSVARLYWIACVGLTIVGLLSMFYIAKTSQVVIAGKLTGEMPREFGAACHVMLLGLLGIVIGISWIGGKRLKGLLNR